MMRRLRCLFRHHLWQPESGTGGVKRGEPVGVFAMWCPRVAITDAQRRFEDPGASGAGGYDGGGGQWRRRLGGGGDGGGS